MDAALSGNTNLTFLTEVPNGGYTEFVLKDSAGHDFLHLGFQQSNGQGVYYYSNGSISLGGAIAADTLYAVTLSLDFTNNTFTESVSGSTGGSTNPLPFNSATTLAAANAGTIRLEGGVGGVGYFDNIGFSVPGDLNGDGLVDLTDYGILKTNWLHTGATSQQGDLNGDGKVDVSDFGLFKHDYDVFNGIGASSDGLSIGVPEPATLGLAVMALPALYLLRRHNRRFH